MMFAVVDAFIKIHARARKVQTPKVDIFRRQNGAMWPGAKEKGRCCRKYPMNGRQKPSPRVSTRQVRCPLEIKERFVGVINGDWGRLDQPLKEYIEGTRVKSRLDFLD
ncbi:hypothetical protein HAX54_032929, partial [Datura stramonium]|nr:hypothetical protein [Datura stramonium]